MEVTQGLILSHDLTKRSFFQLDSLCTIIQYMQLHSRSFPRHVIFPFRVGEIHRKNFGSATRINTLSILICIGTKIN